MARPLEIFFDQNTIIAESGSGLALGTGESRGKFARCRDDAHALAAAAGRGLDQHRIADFAGRRGEPRLALILAVIASNQRHAGRRHQRLRRRLRAHGADRARRRADENDAGFGAGFSEIRVFREKPIAGMDCRGPTRFCRVDQRWDRKITLPRRRRPDRDRLISLGGMARAAIGLGIDGNRLDTHPPRRAHDAAGDFTAIGDEDFVEHRGLTSERRQSAWPRSARSRPPTAQARARGGLPPDR